MNRLILAALVGALALLAPPADASPPSGVTGTILGKTTIAGMDYTLREITIAPGGTTGWHFHDGTLYAYVRSGTLSHFDSNCRQDGNHRPGAAFVERSGSGYVHQGRNLGTEPLVLEVLYVLPAGSPLAEDADGPATC